MELGCSNGSDFPSPLKLAAAQKQPRKKNQGASSADHKAVNLNPNFFSFLIFFFFCISGFAIFYMFQTENFCLLYSKAVSMSPDSMYDSTAHIG